MIKISTNLLSEFSIFNILTESQINDFIDSIKLDTVEKGHDIIKEGQDGNSLILLFDGEVSITKALTLMTNKTEIDTREKEMTKLVYTDRPVFGEMSLFDEDDKRTATITATTDCKIGILESHDFFKICDKDPSIGNIIMRNIAGILAKNLQKTNNQVLKLTTAFSLILEG